MNYPFEFHAVNLTDEIISKLGSREWWGGSGDYMDTLLHIGDFGLALHCVDEKDDENDGYGKQKIYCAKHYCDKDWNTLYFLHELYEYVLAETNNDAVQEFLHNCEQANLGYYIYSYIEFKSAQSW